MRYALAVETADRNCTARVPDLPGGATVAEAGAEFRKAVRSRIDGLRADREIIPQRASIAEYVEA